MSQKKKSAHDFFVERDFAADEDLRFSNRYTLTAKRWLEESTLSYEGKNESFSSRQLFDDLPQLTKVSKKNAKMFGDVRTVRWPK